MIEHPLLNAGINSSPFGDGDFNDLGINAPLYVELVMGERVGRPLMQVDTYWDEADARVLNENLTSKVAREHNTVKIRG